MKTILVIGASGYLGSNIISHLRDKYKVVAAFHRNIVKYPGITALIYTLTDRDYMKRLIGLVKPDVVIYCAGINDLKECVKRQRVAEAVNSFGPVVLSAAADTIVHRFIYLSTAYVFDGQKGNFTEGDVVLPDSIYGKSKLAGENYVRSKSMSFTIMRLSPVFGLGSLYHPSVFDWIRIKLERGQTIDLPHNEVHSFLNIDVFLKSLEWVITAENKNRTYHLGGLTKVSWFQFGQAFADCLGLDKSLIMPVLSELTPQSGPEATGLIDFSLNGSEFVRQLEIDPLVLEEGLDLFKQKLIR